MDSSDWGEPYRASLWGFNPSADRLMWDARARLRLEFYDADGLISDEGVTVIDYDSPLDEWFEGVIEGNVPDGATFVRIHGMFDLANGSRGSIYFDDASFMTMTVVEEETSFAGWQEENFTTQEELDNELVSGPMAEPAGDGMANLLKYALGLPAKTVGTASLPRTEVMQLEGERYLTLTFTRPADRSDIDYVVEASGDLKNWPDLAVREDHLTEDNGDGTLSVTYGDTQPIDDSQVRFLRLRVELNGN